MPRQPNAASRNRRTKGEKCRARSLTTLSTRRARKTATRRPASCHRPRSCPETSPLRGARFSRPLRSSQSVLVDPSWRENSRSEIRPRRRRRVARGRSPSREAVARGRAEAARCGIMRRFTGRSCAALSLSLDRGRRPPKAENRARQSRSKLVCLGVAALGFGRPRRPRRPRLSRSVRR